MRIVCDNCSKKYVISDDKVRGKVFKIRCKKCSHVIVVQGTQDLVSSVEQVDTKVYNFDPNLPAPEDQSAGIEWFFVKDGEQAGPASANEIETYIATGQITDDTYLWREGMDDWLRYREVPEFTGLRAPSMADEPGPVSLPEEADDASGGLDNGLRGVTFSSDNLPAVQFDDSVEPVPVESSPSVMRGGGGGNGHGGSLDAFTASSLDYSEEEATQVVAYDPMADEEPTAGLDSPGMTYTADDPTSPNIQAEPEAVDSNPVDYSGLDEATLPREPIEPEPVVPAPMEPAPMAAIPTPAPVAPEPAYSFEALAAAPTSGGPSGEFSLDQPDLVEARSENSVLFSLDLLSDQGGQQESQTTEGSGLIDIRALAATQGGTADGTERESSGDSGAVLAPAVMPMGRRQSNTVLYIALSAAAVVILALVATIVVVLTRGEEPSDDGDGAIAVVDTPGDDGTSGDGTDQTEGNGAVGDAVMARFMADSATAGSSFAIAVATEARGAADRIVNLQAVAVANPPADRVTNNDRRREREETSNTEDTSEEDDAAAEARRQERRERRENERREREERERAEAAANENDPVAAALSRIRPSENGSSSEEDEPERDEPEAEETAAPPPESDLPEELSTAEVRRTVRRYGRRLAECRQQADLADGDALRVDVAMTVQSTGRVASARTDSSDDAARCVVSVVRDMRFPEFAGDAMSFTYPFRIR